MDKPPGIVYREHPQLSYPDGNIWLSCDDETGCEGSVYGLHRSILVDKSEFMNDLFSLNTKIPSRKGLSKDRPLALPGMIERKDWDHLLYLWFKDPTSKEREDPAFWASVLKVAIPLLAESTAKNALAHLEAFNDTQLDPITKMGLARRCEVDSWIEPCFHALIKYGPITWEQMNVIGDRAYFLIVSVRDRLRRLREQVAHNPTTFKEDTYCMNRMGDVSCEECWEHEWWFGLGKNLTHPDAPWSIRTLIKNLSSNTLSINGICHPCMLGTIPEALSVLDPVGKREVDIIAEGVADIRDYYRGVRSWTKPSARSHLLELEQNRESSDDDPTQP